MLREHQQKTDGKIDDAIARGKRSILATTPTGGGKTIMISHWSKKFNGPNVQIAHRLELTFQISMALARDGIEHRILAPSAVCNFIIEKHIETYGRSFVYASSPVTVASVDTLLSRTDELGNWPKQVVGAQIDEGHHALLANKWGRALNLFPRALRIGWTATAMRPDRKSLRLGPGLTGIYDELVLGPTPRELLDLGYLCPFKIYGPKPSIDMADALIGDSGDYSKAELSARAHKSQIVGDMLEHYLKLAPGKIGIGFAVDVEQAKEFAARFQGAGIPCAWMSSRETDDRVRVRTMDALRNGDIRLIFNVDLLGEGVDVPRVEVVLDGRPTASLVRYLQVFGRVLRTYPGKTHGIYIDMVGNVIRHGMPDRDRVWSLDVPEKRKQTENDEDALTACTKCFRHRPLWQVVCPHCGHRDVPAVPRGASRPEEVHGDLTEYSPDLLERLTREAERLRGAAPRGKVAAYVERGWNERGVALNQLTDAINWWMSTQVQRIGLEAASAYRLFWHRFGIDVATAQTLSVRPAAELTEKLWKDINR